jgi:hypothetical protein
MVRSNRSITGIDRNLLTGYTGIEKPQKYCGFFYAKAQAASFPGMLR